MCATLTGKWEYDQEFAIYDGFQAGILATVLDGIQQETMHTFK